MGVLPDRLFVVRMALGDGTVRVTVAGDLDAGSVAAFRGLAVFRGPAGSPDRVRRLELDLARVTFLDAAGAREILRLRRAALRDGHRVVITAASEVVNAVLAVLQPADVPGYAADGPAVPGPTSPGRDGDA